MADRDMGAQVRALRRIDGRPALEKGRLSPLSGCLLEATGCSVTTSLNNFDNPVLHPIPVFPGLLRLEKPAMAPVHRCNQADAGMLAGDRHEKHRIGDERIVLGGDDCGGYRDTIQHMTCS